MNDAIDQLDYWLERLTKEETTISIEEVREKIRELTGDI